MKNRIWVGRNELGKSYTHTRKMHIEEGILVDNDGELKISSDKGFNYYPLDIYNLNLKPLEIVEIIIDAETQKYEVKRPREIGWYLTVRELEKYSVARYWNGEFWCCKPNESQNYDNASDSRIRVVSEIIRDNEYLKSLE